MGIGMLLRQCTKRIYKEKEGFKNCHAVILQLGLNSIAARARWAAVLWLCDCRYIFTTSMSLLTYQSHYYYQDKYLQIGPTSHKQNGRGQSSSRTRIPVFQDMLLNRFRGVMDNPIARPLGGASVNQYWLAVHFVHGMEYMHSICYTHQLPKSLVS